MDLFLTFSALTLQGVGGVMPMAQRVLVDKKEWMTREQFFEEFAVAQILPGPNVMNLALAFGRWHFGLGGAMAALAGLLTAPLILILIVVPDGTHDIKKSPRMRAGQGSSSKE
jgi:chromate transporter